MNQTRASFESGRKTVALDCLVPANDGQTLPAVIGLHGSGGGHVSMLEPARMLAEQGFAVYVLHYFDRAGSPGADFQSIFRNFPLWMKTVWDAVTFVSREPEVDPQRIGLMGFSLGGYLSVSSSGIDSRIKAVVEFFGGLPRELKYFMRRACPTLILHGEADTTVPVAEAYHLQKVLQAKRVPYEMKIYPGAGHGFSGKIWQDAGLRSVNFLKKYLAGRPDAKKIGAPECPSDPD
ncbi:MAG: carboxymethylenebutenolidase [Acidobacteriaceae bacterium]